MLDKLQRLMTSISLAVLVVVVFGSVMILAGSLMGVW